MDRCKIERNNVAFHKVKSQKYNSVFDDETGFFARWGETFDDDPVMCPVGPELADIEISTICNGFGKSMASRKPCTWCYKSNTGVGENMSAKTFSDILAKFPRTLTQIAFGIGDIDGNPDLWKILSMCREKKVVPNITVNGMGIEGENASKLASLCGAVAVSHYGDDLCFNAIKALTDADLKYVNIHKLLAQETLESCFTLIDKVKSDSRLAKMKAIVFLLLKPKGGRNQLHPIRNLSDYKKLLDYAQEKGVAVGMDSCSAPMALQSLSENCIQSVEPCESTLFSIYINVKGEVFPCSFTEGTLGWETGLNVADFPSFEEVWYHPKLVEWRNGLIGSSKGCSRCHLQKHCRSCPIYDITLCNKLVTIE